MIKNTIHGADLFSGAGGTSTGFTQACQDLNMELDLLAINHWDKAIATHSLNHSTQRHLCESLDNVDPRKAVPGGRLHIMGASPECTHHSNARGGKPCSDQSRATAWHVLRWAEALWIDNIMIENVQEFIKWGPLDARGKVIKSKEGTIFQSFIAALRSIGYNVDYRVVNAADYGDPTSRKRLIILGRRGKPVVWPEPTHGPSCAKPYRTAREIIDWSLAGKSIFGRKKPLKPNTLRRIMAGLQKFGGASFVLGQQSCAAPRSVDQPLPTIATAGAISLVQPFVLSMEHGNSDDRHVVFDLEKPMPTVTTADGFALVEPFLVNMKGQSNACDLDKPLPTITAHAPHMYLCEPFIMHTTHQGSNRVHSVDKPLPTVTCAPRGEMALVEPFLVAFYGRSNVAAIDEPLDTITTKDRFGLVCCEPQKTRLDIRFRMLQPHELAAAMSFPANYEFVGNRQEKVKQIGNAVAVQTARAMALSLLSN